MQITKTLLFGALAIGACRSDPASISSVTLTSLPASTSPLSESASPLSASATPPLMSAASPSALASQNADLPCAPNSLDPARGDALAREAEACLRNPRCSAEEAARLYLMADDVGSARVSCFRFYYGAGVPADPARARACFERAVTRSGDSASLEVVFLGLMLLDGQGGDRDVERGKALFADVADRGVIAATEQRAQSGSATPIDFCADLGGTTADTNLCAQIEQDRKTVSAEVAMKGILAELAVDDPAMALWEKADAAWSAYAAADASYVGDAYRGGSMRTIQQIWVLSRHSGERAGVLRALLDQRPSPKDAESELLRTKTQATTGTQDLQSRTLLSAAEASWVAYRAAETAFVRRALGKIYGGETPIVRALQAELAQRRTTALLVALQAQ